MEFKQHPKPKRPRRQIMIRIAACLGIIAIGIAGKAKLASLKQPPKEVTTQERPLRVTVQKAHLTDIAVQISGYGEVRAVDTVAIAPEVSGRVAAVHPRLEVGERVAVGEVLFQIDDRNYKAAVTEARAAVSQWQSTIERLRLQQKIDTQRLTTLQRNRDLAQTEYERLRKLFEEDKVGTRSGMEQAEQAYNGAQDQVDQLSQALALSPIQIQEAHSNLTSAQARLMLADANLKRCTLTAPFAGRIKSVAIEANQYVSPGATALVLADDSLLEIQVPLDSLDARRWLRFDPRPADPMLAWFAGLQQVPCQVRWTEARDGQQWKGRLHRVVKFDEQSRTLTVAVRITAADAWLPDAKTLPLVEGMFCQVTIPGRTVEKVVRLPRWAVSFRQTAYIAEKGRLKTVPVTVARSEGEFTYVSEGIHAGDQVIVTRLSDPLENSLLELIPEKDKEQAS
jgi:multidrug efflux system membrane fusion protein